MSQKNRDNKNRWRNKTVAFRVSPEEDEQIEAAVLAELRRIEAGGGVGDEFLATIRLITVTLDGMKED